MWQDSTASGYIALPLWAGWTTLASMTEWLHRLLASLHMAVSLPVVLLGLGVVPAVHAAAFYRWVDESGAVQFSEQPPAVGVPRERLQLTPNPSLEEDRPRRDSVVERIKRSDLRRQREVRATADRAAEAVTAAAQASRCAKAQKRLASVLRPRVDRTLEDGTRVRLGEEERQVAIAEAESYLLENDCP